MRSDSHFRQSKVPVSSENQKQPLSPVTGEYVTRKRGSPSLQNNLAAHARNHAIEPGSAPRLLLRTRLTVNAWLPTLSFPGLRCYTPAFRNLQQDPYAVPGAAPCLNFAPLCRRKRIALSLRFERSCSAQSSALYSAGSPSMWA